MADFRVISAGNLSDYATRLYNITLGANATALPTVGDNIYANGFTLQINVSCGLGGGKWSTEANAGLGVTAGGGFNVSVTNLQIIGDRFAGTTTCHNQTTGGLDIFWNGDIQGGSGNNSYGCNNNSTSTINNTATTIQGGSGNNSYGCNNNSTSTINNTATTIQGGSGNTSVGCINSSTGTINNTATTIQGGSANNSHGCINNSIGTINNTCQIVKSGTLSNVYGILNFHKLGVVTVTGVTSIVNELTTDANNFSLAIYNGSTTTPMVFENVDFTNGIGVAGNVIIQNSITIKVNPTDVETFVWDNSTDLSEKDVRKDVWYNFNTRKGELEVPPKSMTAEGVPCDDGVGTAQMLRVSDVLDALRDSDHESAEHFRNTSTNQSVQAQLQAALNS